MKLAHMISSAVLVAVCGCKDSGTAKSGAKGQNQNAHEVAALAIIQKAGIGETKGSYVLRETPSLSGFVIGEDKEKELSDFQKRLADNKEIGAELAAEFIAANRDPKLFQKEDFPTEFRVTLMSEAKITELFSNGLDDGWQRFHQEFDAFGIVTASQPAFSKDGKSALISIWYQYGPLAGHGGFVMLKRVGTSWTIFDVAGELSGVSSVPGKTDAGNDSNGQPFPEEAWIKNEQDFPCGGRENP